MSVIWIAAGAAVGAVVRHALTRGSHARAGLLIANVGGALALGFIMSASLATRHPSAYLVLGTGFCGTLTTMSGLTLAAAERPRGAVTLTTHLLLGVAAASFGLGAVVVPFVFGNASGR